MNNSMYAVFVILCLGILCIGVIYYNTYMYKTELEAYHNFKSNEKETFVNYLMDWEDKKRPYAEKISDIYNTTLENYKSGYNFHSTGKKYYYNYIELSDVKNNNPFFTYGCIKNSTSDDILTDLQALFYVSYIEFYSLNINDIMRKIADDIEKTVLKMNGTALKDPIYFLIYQAPFFKFNNEVYYARHDSINNVKSSYEQNKNDVEVGTKQLLTKIYVMYPYYYHDINNHDRMLAFADETGYERFKNYFHDSKMIRDKLCFIECNTVNNYAWGCLNSDANTTHPYDSKCINLNNELHNYGMVYSINKYHPLFKKNIASSASLIII